MDVLGDLLAPYSDHLAKFAGIITTLQFLSGTFLINDIRKMGRSDAYPPEPFLGGIVVSILTLKMGTLIGDSTTIQVNLLGFAINIAFLTAFYWYASNEYKTKIWSKIGIAGAFIAACLAYASFEHPKKIEFRFSMLITSILVFLVGSPLLQLNKIIEKKSTAGLPFPIILAGTMTAASWALYAVSIRNSVMAYQNLFLMILSSIQLSLFAIYPNTPAKPEYSLLHSPSTLEHIPTPSVSSIGDKKMN